MIGERSATPIRRNDDWGLGAVSWSATRPSHATEARQIRIRGTGTEKTPRLYSSSTA